MSVLNAARQVIGLVHVRSKGNNNSNLASRHTVVSPNSAKEIHHTVGKSHHQMSESLFRIIRKKTMTNSRYLSLANSRRPISSNMGVSSTLEGSNSQEVAARQEDSNLVGEVNRSHSATTVNRWVIGRKSAQNLLRSRQAHAGEAIVGMAILAAINDN